MMLCSISANAGIRTWDFTKWSEATIANLAAEAATYGKGDQTGVTYPSTTLWRSYEKANGTGEQNGNCYWYGTAISENANMKANSVEIEELKGLYFNPFTAGSLAIAVNYPTALINGNENTYAGGSYLWLGGKADKNTTMVIPAVKPGSIITIEVESHNNTDGRGIGLTVNGTPVAPTEGSEKPTVKTKCVWVVPTEGIDTETVDAVFKNNNGCHIYSIVIVDPLEPILPINEALTENTGSFSNAVLMTGTYINGIVAAGGKGIASKAFDINPYEDGIQAYQVAKDEMVTLSWVSYHGWVNSKSDSIIIRNSDGQTIFGYAYDLNGCNITDIQIGGVTAPLFEKFADQGYVGSKSANGWVAKTGQAYLADNANNTVVTVKVFGLGYVEVNMKNEKRSIDKTYSALLPEGFKVDLASLDIVNVSGNTDRSLGINSLSVVSGESTVSLANYTVNRKLQDGTQIDSYTATNISGKPVELSQAAWYNKDGKKYIYVEDDAATIGVLVEGNVYTITYREAAVFKYSVSAVDGEAIPFVEELMNDSIYEGDAALIAYPRYLLKDSVLMETAKTNNEYRLSWTPSKDNDIKYITYDTVKVDSKAITDVVYLAEAENLNSYSIGLLTTSNAAVRASGAKAAYAKYNVNLTQLSSGKYKIVAGLFDATTAYGYTADFAISNDTVASVTAKNVNLTEESAEFNLGTDKSYISWQASGNENQGLDYIYIQRLGDAEFTPVASIAELKAIKNNTPVALTLTDVKLTYSTEDEDCTHPYGYGYMEDATDGIALNNGVLRALGWTSGNTISGTLYAIANTDYYGRPVLNVAGKTADSEATLTPAEITPTEAEVAQLNDTLWQKNFGKLFVLKDVKWAKVAINDYTTNYYLISGTDTILFKDDLYVMPENIPAYEKFNYIQGYVTITYEGEVAFMCNGKYDAVVTPATRVANIGALKDVEDGTDVVLTVDNAVVTVMQTGHSGALIFLEDNTGAVRLSGPDYWGEGGLAALLGIENDSTSISGQIYCRYNNSYSTIMISENDSTQLSTIEKKENVDVIPTALSLAEANEQLARYNMCLVSIDNVRFFTENYEVSVTNGTDTLIIYDMFGLLMDEEYNIITPDENTDFRVVGILMEDNGLATLLPLNYIDMKTVGIKNVTNAEELMKGKVWNINGMRVNSDAKNLKKGVYIINGKKVVVK